MIEKKHIISLRYLFLLFFLSVTSTASETETHFSNCYNCQYFSGTSSCWEGLNPSKWLKDTNCSSYDDWLEEGKKANSSRKKIYCYTKAIKKSQNNSQKAKAYYLRGYAQYYYTLDMTGETWQKSSSNSSTPVDSNMDAAITEESSVSRIDRKNIASKDYLKSIKLDKTNPDTYFELGVYNFWKAFRNEAKSKGEAKEAGNADSWHLPDEVKKEYQTSIDYLSTAISMDKWCSTAYDIRSRAFEKLEQTKNKEENLQVKDILRKHSNKTNSGSGLTGYYCDNKNLTAIRQKKKNSTINFNWGEGKINSIIGSNKVSIKWIGMLEIPEKGSYKFHTYSDDGVKLYINHKTIIDDWNDHGGRWKDSATITYNKNMVGKKVLIVVEWYENGGSAAVKLAWTKPGSSSKAIIPKKYLYPIPNPGGTNFPRFYEGEIGYLSLDIYSNSDSPNTTLWYMDLDQGSYILKGTLNDRLSGFEVPSLYAVTLLQHTNSGHQGYVKGPEKAHASDFKWQENKKTVTLNDKTTKITVKTINGFGK